MSSRSSSTGELRQLIAAVASLTDELAALRLRVQALEDAEDSAFAVVDPPTVTSQRSSTISGSSQPLPAFRVEAAESIGQWLRRSLDGLARGLSGRERIPQANKYYLIARDFENQVYNPPLVLDSWAATKELCQRRGQLGDSIFVGLPTRSEVRIVAQSAGLEIPAAFEQR